MTADYVSITDIQSIVRPSLGRCPYVIPGRVYIHMPGQQKFYDVHKYSMMLDINTCPEE
jgi:hypothetical protein